MLETQHIIPPDFLIPEVYLYGVFGIAMVVAIILSLILYYHWNNYEVSRSRWIPLFLVYLGGVGVFLLMGLGALGSYFA